MTASCWRRCSGQESRPPDFFDLEGFGPHFTFESSKEQQTTEEAVGGGGKAERDEFYYVYDDDDEFTHMAEGQEGPRSGNEMRREHLSEPYYGQAPNELNKKNEHQVADDVLGYYLKKKQEYYNNRLKEQRSRRPPKHIKHPRGGAHVSSTAKAIKESGQRAGEDVETEEQRRHLHNHLWKAKGQPHPAHHQKKAQQAKEMERRIPESIKSIIRDSGSRIIGKVMRNGGATSYKSLGGRAANMLRTAFYGSVYPAFAPDHVTAHLVAQWVNVIAITFAWVALGGLYASTGSTGRHGELASEEDEVWQEFLPDSQQVAYVLREVAAAAEKWHHDEL